MEVALVHFYMRRSRWNSSKSALVNVTVTLLVARLLSAAAIGRASPSWLSQACSHQILRDGHGGCPTMRRSLSS